MGNRPPRTPLVQPGEIDCHAADMTATIAADVPLKSVQQRLGELNQWLPIDGDPELPVGTLVERNSTGPLRLGYGAWRDLLLGCQFRIGTGELITAGGRTMKNVAGYDLTKFMIGQHGVFGQLVSITVRTYLRPTDALIAEFAPSDHWLGDVLLTPLRPRWTLLTEQSLRCGWLDDRPAIDLFHDLAREKRPFRLERRRLEQDIADRAANWPIRDAGARVSLPPTQILQFVQSAKPTAWSADAAFGILLCEAPAERADAIFDVAAACGGSAMIWQKGGIPRWKSSEAEIALLGELKKAFDPSAALPILSFTGR